MTEQPLVELIHTYKTVLQRLSSKAKFEGAEILTCLLTRDKIAEVLNTTETVAPQIILDLAENDQILKKLARPISELEAVTAWRESLNPPQVAWWWYLVAPEQPKGIFERYDWIWNTLNIAVLTIMLALVVDISPRFYRAGTNTAGAFAIVIQSVLAMLTAGGILTKTGAEAIERIFKSLKVPRIMWQEIKFGMAVLLLIMLILFRTYGLPAIARYYHQRGLTYHQQGQLMQAQHDYERALGLNTELTTVTNLAIHYDQGRLYEDLQNFKSASAEYQIAVQGNYLPAYNRLARLKILIDKKYDEAVFLLLNGLKLISDSESDLITGDDLVQLQYDMQKNLGWARLEQGRYREAKAELELAIQLKDEDAAAHCLLAQAIDQLDATEEEPISQESYQAWENCSTYANRLRLEEDRWIYQAQLARLRGLTTTLPLTTSNTTTNLQIEIPPNFHILVASQGNIKLKRVQWTDFQTTTVGVTLHLGDQLFPAENTQAIVLCDDLTTWSVPGGVVSGLANGCSQSNNPILIQPEQPITSTIQVVNPDAPYIISPRQTDILTTTPTLRWNPVLGAITYTVIMTATDFTWLTTTNRSALPYTGTPLLPGERYFLQVRAHNGNTRFSQNAQSISFNVLDSEIARQINRQTAGLGITGQAEIIALAQFYRVKGLNAEAIEVLLTARDVGKPLSTVHYLLGQIYHETGLFDRAEQQYRRTLTLAEEQGDLESQGLAQVGLGQIYVQMGEIERAQLRLNDAQDTYQKLGDLTQLEMIKRQLIDLQ